MINPTPLTRRAFFRLTATAIAVAALPFTAFRRKPRHIFVDGMTTNPVQDGRSWQTAFRKVPPGFDLAGGDHLWITNT